MNDGLCELLRQMSASLSNIEEGMNHISTSLEELRGENPRGSFSELYILTEDIEKAFDDISENCSQIYDKCCEIAKE